VVRITRLDKYDLEPKFGTDYPPSCSKL